MIMILLMIPIEVTLVGMLAVLRFGQSWKAKLPEVGKVRLMMMLMMLSIMKLLKLITLIIIMKLIMLIMISLQVIISL